MVRGGVLRAVCGFLGGALWRSNASSSDSSIGSMSMSSAVTSDSCCLRLLGALSLCICFSAFLAFACSGSFVDYSSSRTWASNLLSSAICSSVLVEVGESLRDGDWLLQDGCFRRPTYPGWWPCAASDQSGSGTRTNGII